MSLFPQGTATHSCSMVCTQTWLSINIGRVLNEGPDSDASPTKTRAPADGSESRSLAEHVKHHRRTSAVSASERWLCDEKAFTLRHELLLESRTTSCIYAY